MQTDPRWKDKDYSAKGESKKRTCGTSGCGPTCAAMLISTITGQDFTPDKACAWSLARGYKAANQGTYYSYFTPQFAEYDIACWQLNGSSLYGKPDSKTHDKALELLKEGHYLIACMGKGLWTSSGHFIVVWWQEGKVYINDPNSKKESRTVADMDTFRRQVKYYFAIDAREYNKEDEDMSYEKWLEYMKRYREELCKMEPHEGWGEKGVQEAMEAGISDGTRPRDLITREEVMCMVTRGMEKAV